MIMDKSVVVFLVITTILILAFAVHQYIFSIYEVTYNVSGYKLYADNQSTVTIQAVPVNALGFIPPFRNSNTVFEIKEGNDLIEIVESNYETGKFVIKAKDLTGVVIIHAKSKYALLPSSFEIIILPNLA